MRRKPARAMPESVSFRDTKFRPHRSTCRSCLVSGGSAEAGFRLAETHTAPSRWRPYRRRSATSHVSCSRAATVLRRELIAGTHEPPLRRGKVRKSPTCETPPPAVLNKEKQKVRADREIEGVIYKWKLRQFGIKVSAGAFPCVVIFQKYVHRRQAQSAQLVRGLDRRPDKLVLVCSGLFEDLVVGCGDAGTKVGGAEPIDGIARHYAAAAASCFRVETRWAIGAPEDTPLQVALSQGEHSTIFVERTAPRHDLIQGKHHRRC